MYNYKITNEEEAKNFNQMLHGFWIDNSCNFENAETILNYYIRKDNFYLIDTKQNNQISFYIGFAAGNYDLIHLLINNKDLKNKNFNISDLSRFYPSDEGLKPILFLIIEDIKKETSVFDTSSKKNNKKFLTSCSDYFVYNIENSFGDEIATRKDLYNFITASKCKFYKNEYNILNTLLTNDSTELFFELYCKLKTSKQQKEMLFFTKNPFSPSYTEYTQNFLNSLQLKFNLENNLVKNEPNKNKFKI